MESHSGKEDQMHGSIFVLLKRFVESSYDFSTWLKLLEACGIDHSPYEMNEMYPTSEIYCILDKATEKTGIPAIELMERYGEFMVPDLFMIYNRYINPEWRTYQMLLHTEEAMHGAVRKEDSRASPPLLLVTKKGNKQLIVDYYSKRRMAGVAIGIIKGIAKYYNESALVEVSLCTPPENERVQIKVDFLE
ncbi:heme NO-binding domain-containing protein [Pontibacter sp. MBLB2868]|uniref:heme NO-binding domain-containing protein n=1 Tax=Pontibacter sp. MBLB2868 TaxID=3451555 RepID=UPI003F750095